MRFSILTLLGLVAFAAFGTAALLNANAVWFSVLFTVIGLVLLTALLLVIYSNAEKRAFWTGFSIFGYGYFLLYWTGSDYTMSEVATTLVIDALMNVAKERFESATMREEIRFFQIGHLLWTMILASAGGLVARYFYWLRQKQEAGVAEQSR
jgi:hypothetical protein